MYEQYCTGQLNIQPIVSAPNDARPFLRNKFRIPKHVVVFLIIWCKGDFTGYMKMQK